MKRNPKIVILKIVSIMLLLMVTAGLAAAGESITGTIAEKGETIVLDAADGSYILEGGEMNASLIGKKVEVTGTITEKENTRVVNVLTIKEVAQ